MRIIKITLIILNLTQFALAQQNQLTNYPYGGVPNFERRGIRDSYAPIDFNGPIIYPLDSMFKEDAIFSKAYFNDLAQFSTVKFAKNADFRSAIFNGKSEFNKVVFKGNANFDNAEFNWLNFSEAFFEDNAVFRNAIIKNAANFSDATFYGSIDFSDAKFRNRANFQNSKFYGSINFIRTYFNEVIRFNYVEFYDSVFIGSQRSDYIQSFDFLMADLIDKAGQFAFENESNKNIIKYSGAAIILTSPVDIKIQLEKFKFIHLKNNLDYFTKKRIIHRLKENFKDDDYRIERFELDYIFAKSTKYQKESSSYVKKHPIKIAIYFFYDLFLGLGYRPFKILKLMIFIITIFAIIYFISSNINLKIDKYIKNILSAKYIKSEDISKKKYIKRIEEFLNCYYFSATIFFNIKIRSEILSSFSFTQKIAIILEWILSLICYISFIKCSKAGFSFGTWAYTLLGRK